MKYLRNYKLFLEDNNPNTPQGYLNSLAKKPKLKSNVIQTQPQLQQQQNTDEIDTILQNTEDQKQKIVARKDAIEKGLLKNVTELEPQNQVDVKTQVDDYKKQVDEFDKTVGQIDKLKKTIKPPVKTTSNASMMMKARQQNNF
jgi:formate dehydrogenase maturation protein FdhE